MRESVCRKYHARDLESAKKTLAKYRAEVAADYPESRAFIMRLIGSFGKPTFNPSNKEHMKEYNEWVDGRKVDYAKWIADLEKQIENQAARLAEWIAGRKPYGLVGFAGRADLAQKRAASMEADYESVEIVAITPEMAREVKPRVKKAAVDAQAGPC